MLSSSVLRAHGMFTVFLEKKSKSGKGKKSAKGKKDGCMMMMMMMIIGRKRIENYFPTVVE